MRRERNCDKTMKEQTEEDKSIKSEEYEKANSVSENEPAPGILWRLSGGVYNKAATVVGGVGWIAGSALSTTYGAVSTVGGYAITPFRKAPKHKSD